MKEIFTFNLGLSGNFSSSYFWQIQDMYSKPPEFHQSFFVQTSEGYFPRMLGVDKKESMSFPVPLTKQESEVLWGGKITKIDQDPETEEKWTDLLVGMISRRNMLPVYRDFSVSEELEDQIRFFAESADRLQGIHTLCDNDFSGLMIEGLHVLEDFYPKAPNLLFSFNYKNTAEEKITLWRLGEFSNTILVPCTEAGSKVQFSQIATGLDVVSFYYRMHEEMHSQLSGFYKFSHGNSCEFSLNSQHFSPRGIVFNDLSFIRESENKVMLPETFPISESPQYLAKLFQSSYLETFYSSFANLTNHNINPDDLKEAHNYLTSLAEKYSEMDFLE